MLKGLTCYTLLDKLKTSLTCAYDMHIGYFDGMHGHKRIRF